MTNFWVWVLSPFSLYWIQFHRDSKSYFPVIAVIVPCFIHCFCSTWVDTFAKKGARGAIQGEAPDQEVHSTAVMGSYDENSRMLTDLQWHIHIQSNGQEMKTYLCEKN